MKTCCGCNGPTYKFFSYVEGGDEGLNVRVCPYQGTELYGQSKWVIFHKGNELLIDRVCLSAYKSDEAIFDGLSCLADKGFFILDKTALNKTTISDILGGDHYSCFE